MQLEKWGLHKNIYRLGFAIFSMLEKLNFSIDPRYIKSLRFPLEILAHLIFLIRHSEAN